MWNVSIQHFSCVNCKTYAILAQLKLQFLLLSFRELDCKIMKKIKNILLKRNVLFHLQEKKIYCRRSDFGMGILVSLIHLLFVKA